MAKKKSSVKSATAKRPPAKPSATHRAPVRTHKKAGPIPKEATAVPTKPKTGRALQPSASALPAITAPEASQVPPPSESKPAFTSVQADLTAPPAFDSLPKTPPLSISIQTAQGAAAHGNNQPANLLVIVTCTGWPVTDLDKNHFTLMEHFEVPGQQASFSNSISSFKNAGTGAYLLQTRPINGAPWHSGHHLGQLLISTSDDRQGQAAFKLIIR